MVSRVDKENTVRSLQDKPLAINSWKCRWGWHTWSRWCEPKLDSYKVYVIQQGECVFCNRKRVERLGHA